VDKEQLKLIEEIRKSEALQSGRWLDYWHEYSSFHTWQFWVVAAMLLLPLILLILFIDRRKLLHLCFYGYSVHIFFAISDALGVLKGVWIYPFKLFPMLPANLALDSSLVPVSYMFLYQYILNKEKNY
jgi:hypothetical protein